MSKYLFSGFILAIMPIFFSCHRPFQCDGFKENQLPYNLTHFTKSMTFEVGGDTVVLKTKYIDNEKFLLLSLYCEFNYTIWLRSDDDNHDVSYRFYNEDDSLYLTLLVDGVSDGIPINILTLKETNMLRNFHKIGIPDSLKIDSLELFKLRPVTIYYSDKRIKHFIDG